MTTIQTMTTKERYCSRCIKLVEPVFTATPSGPHHGRLDCPNCKRFIAWQPKPSKNMASAGKACDSSENFRISLIRQKEQQDRCPFCHRPKALLACPRCGNVFCMDCAFEDASGEYICEECGGKEKQ